EMCEARQQDGTSERQHPPQERLIGTFVTLTNLHGRRDWVTITEADQSTRIERRIAWSPPIGAANGVERNRTAFTDFVPRDYSATRGARLIKRPSSELPTRVSKL